MRIGSTDTRKFKNFQIRWNEKMFQGKKHYLTRWTLIIGGYSIRLHHWLSDDVAAGRFYHNHSSNLISIVLSGKYWNVTPKFKTRNANEWIPGIGINREIHVVTGLFNLFKSYLPDKKFIWFSKAEDFHYLRIIEPSWTILLEGKPKNKWGFMVNGKLLRPLRFFNKFKEYTRS